MKKTIGLIFFALISFANGYAQSWHSLGNPGFSAGAVGNTQIAVDKNGIPYIFFADSINNYRATVMKYNGVNWINVGNTGFSDSGIYDANLVIDAADTLYVAYSETKLSVQKFNGASWEYVGTEGFTANSINCLSLAIDSNGNPYVAFVDAVTLKASVMKFNGTDWVYVGINGNAAVSDSTAAYLSMALDQNGTPYVAYEDGGQSGMATVKKYDGTNWITVGARGFSLGGVMFTIIAVDKNGTIYVSYRDEYISMPDFVSCMKYDGTNWVYVGNPRFNGTQIYTQTMQLDSNGLPYVAYEDFNYKPSVMKFDGTNWDFVGQQEFSDSTTFALSMALDHNSDPFVVYADRGQSDKATVKYFSYLMGIDHLNTPQMELEIYPNPAQNTATIEWPPSAGEDTRLAIYDLLGSPVYNLKTDGAAGRAQIDISTLPNGLYLVKLYTANGGVAIGKMGVVK